MEINEHKRILEDFAIFLIKKISNRPLSQIALQKLSDYIDEFYELKLMYMDHDEMQ
jgi:hypothetical protein